MIDTTEYNGETVYHDSTVDKFYRFDAGTDETEVLDPDGRSVETLDTDEFHDLANDGMLTAIPSDVVDDPGEFLDGRLKRLQKGFYDKGERPTHREKVVIQYARHRVTTAEWEPNEPPAAVLCIPTEEDVEQIDRILRNQFRKIEAEYTSGEARDIVETLGSLYQELLGQLNDQRDE